MEKEICKKIDKLTEVLNNRLDKTEENIEKINKLLLGNGGVGLCEQVRKLQASITPLWTLVGIIGVALIGGIIKLFFGG